MKRYTVKVECKGCKNEILVGFIVPKAWCDRNFESTCSACESEIRIEVKQGAMKRNILTRVQMLKHSEKLLTLLKERLSHA